MHPEWDLIYASSYGKLDDVKSLISVGAGVKSHDNLAVQWAAENGHLETVKYLVSVGADITAGKNYAIIRASRKGHLSVVRYLISVGANYNGFGLHKVLGLKRLPQSRNQMLGILDVFLVNKE